MRPSANQKTACRKTPSPRCRAEMRLRKGAVIEVVAAKWEACRIFGLLIRQGHPLVSAAFLAGKPPSFFSGTNSTYQRYLAGGVYALIPKRSRGAFFWTPRSNSRRSKAE